MPSRSLNPRLAICLAVSLLLAACSDSNDGFQAQQPPPPLSTAALLDSGPIEGALSERAAAWAYLGIPFAQPPVGDLRWKAPRPVEPWIETRAADALADFCPQFQYFSNAFSGSEDCLYLNVFRPQSQQRDLPVFLWIHGGGNNNGDTGQEFPVYDGARLAERGNLLVVTVQYRLGALGWLYNPALQTGEALDDSGNFGTLDLVAALEWLQRNAEAFGGDPGNVTVVGESAGAANVLTLLLSPQAQGLFHKGIVQSLGGTVTDRELAKDQSDALIADLLLLGNEAGQSPEGEELAAYLRSVDPETVLATANTSEIIGDGFVLPEDGYDRFASGDFPNKVPLLFGTNKDEQKLYTNPLGFNAYPDGPQALRDAVGRYLSDAWRVTGADALATRLRALDDMPDLFVYRFNWGSPDEAGNSPYPAGFGESGGAFHSSEISFMLGNEDIFVFDDFTQFFFLESNAQSRATISDVMVSYWSSFARSSDPNGGSLPAWEAWSNADDGFKAVTLDVNYLDNSPRVEPDPSVLTEQDVYDAARANLEGDILADVIDLLDRWFAAYRVGS